MVVTLNYRLGALGFFAHPAYLRESDRKVSSSYGLLGQIAALSLGPRQHRGVWRNPSNVTVFGQSAGASSGAGALMVSPLARGCSIASLPRAPGRQGQSVEPRLRAP